MTCPIYRPEQPLPGALAAVTDIAAPLLLLQLTSSAGLETEGVESGSLSPLCHYQAPATGERASGVAGAREALEEAREEARISPRPPGPPGRWVHACSLSPTAWPGFKSSCQLNWTAKTDSFFS